MATCEMCGYGGRVRQGIVEGTMLFLCDKCMRYGDAVEVTKPPKDLVERRLSFNPRRSFSSIVDRDERIVGNCAILVKQARERSGRTQEEVAKALAERSSVIQRVESGNLEPPLKLAKKLEQYFKLELIVKLEKEVKKEELKEFSLKNEGLTIGDMLDIKKSKSK